MFPTLVEKNLLRNIPNDTVVKLINKVELNLVILYHNEKNTLSYNLKINALRHTIVKNCFLKMAYDEICGYCLEMNVY